MLTNNKIFKSRTKKKSKFYEIQSLLIFLIGILLLVVFIFPLNYGLLGTKLKNFLIHIFGQIGIFFLPGFLFFYSTKIFKTEKIKLFEWSILSLLVIFGCSLLSAVNYGGIFGEFFYKKILIKLFGVQLSIIISVFSLIYFSSLILNISLIGLIKTLVDKIQQDIREWQNTRNLIKKTQIKQGVPEFQETPKTLTPTVPEKPTSVEIKDILKKSIKEKTKDEQESEIIQNTQYIFPGIELLSPSTKLGKEFKQEELIAQSNLLEKTLSNFNVFVKVTDICPGPVVTRFDLTPQPGVKVQSIVSLSNDISLAMKAQSVRIIAPVPEKGTVGIEISNPQTKIIGLHQIISSIEFQKNESLLTLGLGNTTDGKPYITDLIPMPHLLIAGATGSGKSVCIHSIIMSILYKASPDEVKFLLIDPKRLELPVYNGLPHLYDPKTNCDRVEVVTKPKLASESLKALVKVMEKRYEKFAKVAVRNIDGYNKLMQKDGQKKEFYIVVIIDELADLMLTLPKEIEDSVQRLAQMARAVGIHLILATQRPSVDVITGVIKANLSSRIAFQVLSKIDSRVILDTIGAEDLLGRGDMLFLPTGVPKPIRLQGSFVSEKEVEEVVKFIKKQKFKTEYDEIIVPEKEEQKDEDEKMQVFLKEALELILERKRVSQDLLKAHFGSSSRATDILSLLEIKGFIYKPEGTNRWQIFFDKIEEELNGLMS